MSSRTTPESQRRRYMSLRKRGLCVRCLADAAWPDRSMCAVCAAKERIKKRVVRIEKIMALTVGSPTSQQKVPIK
jgi:hypothetical protein